MSVANHRRAFRPVLGGTLLVQSATLDAGTLGMIVTSNGADRWLLTARHVVTRRDGTLVTNDVLFQPDAAGGSIGSLSNVLTDVNLDCAAVKLTVGASNEVLGIGQLRPHVAPTVGMRVLKSAWKTGISEGVIQQVNGSEVLIQRLPQYPTDYLLAAVGDSGGVWLQANTYAPVALHRRETGVGLHLAIASDIRSVLGTLHLQQV
jgi:hypothetical protein